MADNDLFSTTIAGDMAALQKELARLDKAVNPAGGIRDTMTLAVGMLHRYATGIVHVDTGRLKNSIFWDIENAHGNSLIGHVATNVNYSIFEERRGGSHAFFERTVREEGRKVNDLFARRITGGRR